MRVEKLILKKEGANKTGNGAQKEEIKDTGLGKMGYIKALRFELEESLVFRLLLFNLYLFE